MTTPSDIILQALKKSGVLGAGQNASPTDFNDAFLDLNDMLAMWQRQRWLVWHLSTFSITSTGAQSYTIGPGGDFDTRRPDRLESAYLRQIITSQPNVVDYPLEIIESREDYNRIALKTLGTFPRYIFYDAAYPMGIIYPWPIPQPSTYQVFISIKQNIGQFTSLNETILMPPEYIGAMKFNLAVRLREAYQLAPREMLSNIALATLNVIRGANAQIARLQMPDDLVTNGNYNIFSDQIR